VPPAPGSPHEELSVSHHVGVNDDGQSWTGLDPRPRLDLAGADPGANTIETGRLVLRELTAAQVAGLLRLLEEGGTSAACVPGYPLAGSGFAARHFTERTPDERRPGFGMYLLVRRSDGLAIGDMGFHRPPKDGVTEIGFGLAQSARGHGYATEAATALSRWALAQDGVSRVVARTDPGNVGSQNVLTRAGFRHEFTQDDVRHYVLLPDGRPHV
jgi:RimJ/RimL family protein N-acetyltransferase